LKAKIDESLKELKETVKGEDVEKIRSGMDKLRKAVQEVGSNIYQQSQEQQNTGPEEEAKKDEEVVDADYKVEEDDK